MEQIKSPSMHDLLGQDKLKDDQLSQNKRNEEMWQQWLQSWGFGFYHDSSALQRPTEKSIDDIIDSGNKKDEKIFDPNQQYGPFQSENNSTKDDKDILKTAQNVADALKWKGLNAQNQLDTIFSSQRENSVYSLHIPQDELMQDSQLTNMNKNTSNNKSKKQQQYANIPSYLLKHTVASAQKSRKKKNEEDEEEFLNCEAELKGQVAVHIGNARVPVLAINASRANNG
ncbi:MAG: hypothetical protein EZS28_008494 [Streblomastix strix]|uniref:Uncharacterized protein n=1 Tax=Streblomastix strix TaxID=222440 RepID=A0A5J4WP50_9EUKA|nr:MAG: hypothetical protein EZS28_008494 [Streblomastix strix]